MSGLGKYVRLVVAGQRITEEQADVVLVRTRVPWVLTSDYGWQSVVEQALGMPEEKRHLEETARLWRELGAEAAAGETSRYFAAADASWRRLGLMSLSFLCNTRIANIGGPEGWCDWNGDIGCSSYNIGKWPTVEELTEEWRDIAETFPFLKLDCQVVDEEGRGGIAAQWHVENGLVRQTEIGPLLRPLEERDYGSFFVEGSDRGVSIVRLRGAVARTLESLQG